MASQVRRPRLNTFVWVGLLLLTLALAGCTTTIGSATVIVRPGTRIPDRVVETVTGEHELMDGIDPEGDTIMLMMRAYW